MRIPPNMTEAEVIETINKVASKLAYKFVFGSYTYEDIKHQAWIIAIEGLDDYKPTLPLENFLWVHVRNRLINFKRDNFIRLDKPCATCPLKAYVKKGDICKAYDNKMDCDLYSHWVDKNTRKENLVKGASLSAHDEPSHSDPTTSLFHADIIRIIDENMSVELRHIWLKAKGGVKLYKDERELLEKEVVNICAKKGIDESCLH